ncbi:MAG: hypothetical protein QM727_15790 [Niabella sp.]
MKRIFAYIIFSIAALPAISQNVSSPYSILGIGDIESSEFGRYGSTGGNSLGKRDALYYNHSNPASLTGFAPKTVVFDFSTRGRFSQFKEPGKDTFSQVSKDLVIKQIALAFRGGKNTAFAFGLRPFSSVNYKYESLTGITDGPATLQKNVEGNGGMNQAFLSVAQALGKRFSAGVTGSWLFGSMQRTTSYYNPDINVDITKDEDRFYNGASALLGLQYHPRAGKKWAHTIGATGGIYTELTGSNHIDYIQSGLSIADAKVDEDAPKYKMPVTAALGYTATNKNGFSMSAQGSYQKWPKQKLAFINSYTSDAFRLGAGAEYSKRVSQGNLSYEKYHVGVGAKMERSYMLINQQHLEDYSVTLGGSYNVSWMLSINAGLEAGKRGINSNKKLIQENYYQFYVGFTVRDFWFSTRKYGL